MASGYTMVPTEHRKGEVKMAKNKTTTSKSPSGQKIQAGPSGKMHNFKGVGAQKPGVSSVESSGGGGKFAKAGPSGKMHKFTPVKAVKKA